VDSTAHLIKSQLRKRFRAEREFLVVDSNWEHLLETQEVVAAQVVASYVSYGLEPDTKSLNAALIRLGKTLLIPHMLPDKDLEWRTTDDQIYSGPIDVVIMPALHIDRIGNRLGQGGGSYDRALTRTKAWRVALIYPGELSSEEIPHESHDQLVDAAATAEILVRFTGPN
jgi:5-formyltetrahydrofolate cyclo-ligase